MILVSGCLAGINCKYNGENNYDERIFNLVKEGKAIPVCPEQLGGLKTPRNSAEIQNKNGECVVATKYGEDVTLEYARGAKEVLRLAKELDVKEVILQPRSPSCGKGLIYDGTFSKNKIEGNGITADLLIKNGIKVYMPDEYFSFERIKNGTNTTDLKSSIERFKPYNEQEEVEKRIMLKYIEDFDDVLTRQNEYGHFTSSAFVLNKERTKMLMIYHKIYNSWAWTGGHSDGDSNLLHVAMKEAKEETGIKNVRPIFDDIYSLEIINVNGHEKRGKYVGSHVHLNVTYLLEADENEAVHIKEDENSGVKWVPIDEIVKITSGKWVRDRVYAKIISKMKNDGIIL